MLGSGFSDPVLQSQATFRAVMDGMARPGSIHAIAPRALLPPAPISPCTAAVALTLCDHDTPVWLDPDLMRAPGLTEWLTFHTGAPMTDDPRRAAFGIVWQASSLPPLDGFEAGSDEYPDRSTTLIVQVADLAGGGAMTLAGPGILGSQRFAPRGLPKDFAARWAANNGLFPRGVDVILCAPAELAALPRTTRMTTGPAS